MAFITVSRWIGKNANEKVAPLNSVWFEDRQVILKHSERPVPASGQALIKVLLAGICGTDLHLLHGYYDFRGTPGHEFVGEVIAAPDDPVWVGKRVVADINIACGRCRFCLRNHPHHCEHRQALGISQAGGAFAEYLVLPLVNLYAVPDNVSNEKAVFAEPLAAAAHVLGAMDLQADSKVLLLGAGKLGLLIAQVLASAGYHLDVVARYEKQCLLLQQFGVTPVQEHELSPQSYAFVVEATGSASGFSTALQCVEAQGCVVLKSTFHGRLQLEASRLVVDELRIVGSRCGSIAQALDLLSLGVVDPRPLIDEIFPLVQAAKAFETAAQKGVLKVLLRV